MWYIHVALGEEMTSTGEGGQESRVDQTAAPGLRPAAFCRPLLAVLNASEGRRKRRARNTPPDAIGMTLKRDLLAGAVRDDPVPEAFEGWLFQHCLAAGAASGAVRAMVLGILQEWRLAAASPAFRQWLNAGAPSDDIGEV
jgi:hypothetical protein